MEVWIPVILLVLSLVKNLLQHFDNKKWAGATGILITSIETADKTGLVKRAVRNTAGSDTPVGKLIHQEVRRRVF